MVYILESAELRLFEVWESIEALKAHFADAPYRIMPYGEGWNVYVKGRYTGRLLPIGSIRGYEVKK